MTCSSPRRDRRGWPDRSCASENTTWCTGEDDNSEAWLLFPNRAGGGLHMAKVDPDADFSDDYEDLAFKREHGCD